MAIYWIVGIDVLLHFVAGFGFLIYKMQKPKKSKDQGSS